MYERIQEVTLKITSLCNLKCSYCFQRSQVKDKDDYFSDYDKLLEFLIEQPMKEYVEIKLTGGESSLYPERIKEIHRVLKKLERYKNIKVIFSTISNGSNIDALLELMDKKILNPDYCKISYDGIYSESKSRHSKGLLSKYTDKFYNDMIRKLGSSKYADRVLIRTAITKETLENLFESVKFITDSGCKKWEYYFISDYEDYKKAEVMGEFRNQLKSIIELYESNPFNFYNLIVYKYMNIMKEIKDYRLTKCRHLGRFLYIHTDGTIYPCGYFSPDGYYSEEKFCIGDLDNGLNKEAILLFEKEYLNKPSCSITEENGCRLYHCFECPGVSHYRKKNMMSRLMQQCGMRVVEDMIFKYCKEDYDIEYLKKIMIPYN